MILLNLEKQLMEFVNQLSYIDDQKKAAFVDKMKKAITPMLDGRYKEANRYLELERQDSR